MTAIKTRQHAGDVSAFLDAVPNATRRNDARIVLGMLEKITGKKARMWGTSIVGFDEYHYEYASGQAGDMCMPGFSPRAQALTLYMLPGFSGQQELLQKLGRHKAGKGCLYISGLTSQAQPNQYPT